MTNENYKGVFGGLKFDKYQFREFPKWVKDHQGNDVLVQDQREELAIISMVPAGKSDPVVEEKNRLVQLLDANEKAKLAQNAENEALKKQLEESNKLLAEMGNALRKLEQEKGTKAPEPEKEKVAEPKTPPLTAPPPQAGGILDSLKSK